MSEAGIKRYRMSRTDDDELVLVNEDDGSVLSTSMSQTDWARLEAMTDEEVEAAALADPDAQPMTPEQLAEPGWRPLWLREIRADLQLTEEQFAERFQIPLEQLRGWEHGWTLPDRPARTLLRVIAHAPEVVEKALAPDVPVPSDADRVGEREPAVRAS